MPLDVDDAQSSGIDIETVWADAVLAHEGPLTADQAREVLCLARDAPFDADAAKTAFRRLSLKWHPDKQAGEDAKKRATALFVRISAAFHTLTTSNFDYTRWSSSFVIPSMQTLEDVLLLAMKGEDPFVVDALLRKRGDYRPHAHFGVDLAVPWSAGTRKEPSWEVAGAAHSTTQALPAADAQTSGAGSAADMQLALREILHDSPIEAQRYVGASDARPWERVGAAGWSAVSCPENGNAPGVPLRPDLQPGMDGAKAAAETLNDAGLAHHAKKEHRQAAAAFDEAFRLCPDSAIYASNGAAAHLAAGNARRAAQSARDSLALNPSHVRSLCRLGEACLALGEAAADRGAGDRGKAHLAEARASFKQALQLEPGNKVATKGLKDVALTWAAEFDSDEE